MYKSDAQDVDVDVDVGPDGRPGGRGTGTAGWLALLPYTWIEGGHGMEHLGWGGTGTITVYKDRDSEQKTGPVLEHGPCMIPVLV